MKLSRKAKKRLIILGVMLSPVFLILVIYLAHLGEPGEYTALKEQLYTEQEESAEQQDSIKRIQPKLPDKYELSEIHPYALKSMILERVPSLEGAISRGTPYKEDLIDCINSYQPFSGFTCFRNKSKITYTGISELHELCDQVEDILLGDSDRTPAEMGQLLVINHVYYPGFIHLTIIRAALAGDQNKARSLFDKLVGMMSYKGPDKIQFDIQNTFTIEFLWWCYDLGVVEIDRIKKLKEMFISEYFAFRDLEVSPPRYEERNSEIIAQCEEFCQYIQNEDISSRNNSWIIFLRSNLGGFPLDAWNGMLEPVRIQRAKKLAVAMTSDDQEAIEQAREKLAMVAYGMRGRGGFHYVDDLKYGIYLPMITETFPWFRTDQSNFALNYYFGKIAFLTMLEEKEKSGAYPTGELIVEGLEEPVPGFHNAFVHVPDEFKGSVSIYTTKDGKTDTVEKIDFQAPSRPAFIYGYSSHCFEGDKGKIYSIDQINEKCKQDKEFIHQIKTDHAYQSYYQWYASNWPEVEPVLRNILIDQRPNNKEKR